MNSHYNIRYKLEKEKWGVRSKNKVETESFPSQGQSERGYSWLGEARKMKTVIMFLDSLLGTLSMPLGL